MTTPTDESTGGARRITHDRGEIIHFIGRQHGSPALRSGGEPVISTAHGLEEGITRVGWAAFFEAVEARRLVLSFDNESGAFEWIADPRH